MCFLAVPKACARARVLITGVPLHAGFVQWGGSERLDGVEDAERIEQSFFRSLFTRAVKHD
jgi:hypothetical protein